MARIDPNYVAVAHGIMKAERVGPLPVKEQSGLSGMLSSLNSKRKGITSQARAAARNGNAAKLRELLPKVSNVNKPSKDDFGYTIAHAAAQSSNPDVTAVLVEHGGVDFNKRALTNPQPTPVHIATLLGNTAVAEKMVAAGGDLNLPTATLDLHTHGPILLSLAGCTATEAAERVVYLQGVRSHFLGLQDNEPTVDALLQLPSYAEHAPPTYENLNEN